MARHLWRSWNVVRHALMPDDQASSSPGESHHWPKVPPRTVRRWCARWWRPAKALAQILAASGEPAWAALATRLRPDATCSDLVATYAREHIGQLVGASETIRSPHLNRAHGRRCERRRHLDSDRVDAA